MNLPENYINKLKPILRDELDDYIKSFDQPRTFGIRFNDLKVNDYKSFIDKFDLEFNEKIPWTSNGYYYDESYRPGKQPAYYAGLYYMQDPSAMSPAQVLPVKPGDKVLDMCAAPGGKSTEIISKLKGEGILVSNDMSTSRCKALIKNIEVWGSRNVIVTSEDATSLEDHFPNYFDKILLDAPCSGEGMFRKENKMINAWKEHGPDVFSPIQKQLLNNAVNMLNEDGYLVYSTCTYALEEDEENLKYILEKFPEMEMVDLPIVDGALMGNSKLVDGDKSIDKSMKFFSHRLKGEGQFVSLLHKKTNKTIENKQYVSPNLVTIEDYIKNNKDKKITTETREFLSLLKFNIYDNEEIVVRNDNVFLQRNDIIDLSGLRILRNGLLLGTIKKKRFEPSQALSMILNDNSFFNTLFLDKNDDRIIKYLKGETIEYNESIKNGYVLVCYDKYPLGWGKANKGIIKNKYLSGWRYN